MSKKYDYENGGYGCLLPIFFCIIFVFIIVFSIFYQTTTLPESSYTNSRPAPKTSYIPKGISQTDYLRIKQEIKELNILLDINSELAIDIVKFLNKPINNLNSYWMLKESIDINKRIVTELALLAREKDKLMKREVAMEARCINLRNNNIAAHREIIRLKKLIKGE